MTDYLGWAATTVFVGSYFCTKADALKRVQMIGALMWVAYGILIKASPVVAANLLVFGAAGWTVMRAHTDATKVRSQKSEVRSTKSEVRSTK